MTTPQSNSPSGDDAVNPQTNEIIENLAPMLDQVWPVIWVLNDAQWEYFQAADIAKADMRLLQGQLTDIEDFIHDKLRKYVALTSEKTDTKKRKKKGEKSRFSFC